MKKRVALAAVAALAGGLLVAAPASAATISADPFIVTAYADSTANGDWTDLNGSTHSVTGFDPYNVTTLAAAGSSVTVSSAGVADDADFGAGFAVHIPVSGAVATVTTTQPTAWSGTEQTELFACISNGPGNNGPAAPAADGVWTKVQDVTTNYTGAVTAAPAATVTAAAGGPTVSFANGVINGEYTVPADVNTDVEPLPGDACNTVGASLTVKHYTQVVAPAHGSQKIVFTTPSVDLSSNINYSNTAEDYFYSMINVSVVADNRNFDHATSSIAAVGNGVVPTGSTTSVSGPALTWLPTYQQAAVAEINIEQFSNISTLSNPAALSHTADKSAVAIDATLEGVGSMGPEANGGNLYASHVLFNTGINGDTKISSDRIYVFSDSRLGTAKITIKVGTQTFVYTVTFYGKLASVKLVQNYTIASTDGGYVGTGTNNAPVKGVHQAPATGAFSVTPVDAAGNIVYTAEQSGWKSSDALSLNIVGTDAWTGPAVNDVYSYTSTANVSGASANVSLTFTDAANMVAPNDTPTSVSTTVTFKFGGAVKTLTGAFDAAKYVIGGKAKLTLTAKDAAGNAAFDGALAADDLASNASIGLGWNDGTGVFYVYGGSQSWSGFAPLAPLNPWAVTADGEALASAVVYDGTAAANNDANAKAIADLQASLGTLTNTVASLVASMTAQIKVINATILKIQKSIVALRLQVKNWKAKK